MGDMSDRVKLAREIAARTEPRFIDTTRDASTDHRAPAEADAYTIHPSSLALSLAAFQARA